MLTCIEVQQNGNVIIHWIPPSPVSQFSHYEIWFGISKQSPFSLVSPTVAPVSTQSFVHATSAGTAQTLYYYMRSVMTDGTFSQRSDTVQTILLDVIPGDPSINILYNRP